MAESRSWEDFTFSARDGLRLHGRRYPAPASRRRPAVCLAGLTRNVRDFHDLALSLSAGVDARPVFALDSRGRGASQHDPNWRNYSVHIEMLDAQDFLTLLDLDDPVVIGTSRGGIIAMLLAVAQPTRLGAVVLNDIGPVIEPDGLARISAYVGKIPLPESWAAAGRLIAKMSHRAFPAVPDTQWEEVARQWFNDAEGRPAPSYDPRIARTFASGGNTIPALWPQFGALSHVPLLVIRGEHSDILSEETVHQMRARHPACAALTVPGQGHAPLLKDPGSIGALSGFLADVDAGRSIAGRVLKIAS